MVSTLQKCTKQIKGSLWVFGLRVTHPYCFRCTCGCLLVSGKGRNTYKALVCRRSYFHEEDSPLHLTSSMPPPPHFLYISFNFYQKGDDRPSFYVFFPIQIFLCYPAETKPAVPASSGTCFIS